MGVVGIATKEDMDVHWNVSMGALESCTRLFGFRKYFALLRMESYFCGNIPHSEVKFDVADDIEPGSREMASSPAGTSAPFHPRCGTLKLQDRSG